MMENLDKARELLNAVDDDTDFTIEQAIALAHAYAAIAQADLLQRIASALENQGLGMPRSGRDES